MHMKLLCLISTGNMCGCVFPRHALDIETLDFCGEFKKRKKKKEKEKQKSKRRKSYFSTTGHFNYSCFFFGLTDRETDKQVGTGKEVCAEHDS